MTSFKKTTQNFISQWQNFFPRCERSGVKISARRPTTSLKFYMDYFSSWLFPFTFFWIRCYVSFILCTLLFFLTFPLNMTSSVTPCQMMWLNATTGRLRLKCDGTLTETRFRLSAKRTSPFQSAGASVQSTTGSRGVRISGSSAGYTMFRGSVKSTGYTLHSPVYPSHPLPCVTVCHHVSTGVYKLRVPAPPLHLEIFRLRDLFLGTHNVAWNYLSCVKSY